MKLLDNIMIFGDSIMKGVVLSESDRRYRIGSGLGIDALAQRFGLNIANHSRFGCTLEKGLGVLQRTVERNPDCGAVIMEYGGNDCDFDWAQVAAEPEKEHFPNTSLDRFTELYAGAIEYLRGRGIVPVLTTLPPLCAERYFNWICRSGLDRGSILGWLGDIDVIYRYQKNYSKAVEQLADRFDTALIDLRSAFLAEKQLEDFYCADGIHPNENGQHLIQNAFSDFFAQAKGAEI